MSEMNPVDWQTGKTPWECTKYMLDNEINCDVKFKVGEDKTIIKAHKLILSMRSAVLDRMFNGSFCESEKDPVIPDVTSEAFKMMLRYCYYECLDIKDDIALDVLYASTKYMLPLLEEAARKKLSENLSGSNAWDVYKYAIYLGDAKLIEACHKYFQGNTTSVKEALQADAFLQIPHKVLVEFLHINGKGLKGNPINGHEEYVNSFGISISEIELFKSCNAWAEAECLRREIHPTGANKRKVLGECLFMIRFPTMLQKDLVNVVYPTGILTPVEIVNLGQYKHKDPGSECRVEFPSEERQFVVTAPEPTTSFSKRSTVYIESEKRVMLSRVWVSWPGSYIVTVQDETSGGARSMTYGTQLLNHVTKRIDDKQHLLYLLDIKPQLLESGTRYSLTAEREPQSSPPDQNPNSNQLLESEHADLVEKKLVVIGDLSPFKEVRIMQHPKMDKCIYALTLRLV